MQIRVIKGKATKEELIKARELKDGKNNLLITL
jgi:hypothetical protein